MDSASEPTKQVYVSLIQKYLNGEIAESVYGSEFQKLVAQHTAIQEQKSASWPERYDDQVVTEYLAGKITVEEFKRQWRRLWGDSPQWHDIVYLDLVYLGDRRPGTDEILQAFQNSPDEYSRTYFLTEEELKDELRNYLKQLEDSDG